MLTVPVTLELNADKLDEDKTKPVELTSWTDKGLKEKVSLTDDQDKSYKLLEQINSEGKTITKKRIKVQLIFQAPTSKKPQLKLVLPAAALPG